MLLVGRQTQRTCRTVNRRAFLQAGASSVLGLSLADWLRAKDGPSGHTPGPAKAVILILSPASAIFCSAPIARLPLLVAMTPMAVIHGSFEPLGL